MAEYKVDFAYTTTLWDQVQMDLPEDRFAQEDAIHDQLRILYPEGRDFEIEGVNKIA